MNVWATVVALVLLVIALAVVKRVAVWANSRQGKGKIGEFIVSRRLRKGLPENEYEIVNDVYLPLDDGTTTQIDHIIVSRYGVFVVETKNYTGWIFADAKSHVWTQTIYREKHTFQNPIRQNYLHLCTLSNRLGVPIEMVHGVVAFTGDCKFKTEMPSGVVFSRKLAAHIQSFDKPILKDSEVADIVSALHEWNASVTDGQHRAHVANLRARHSNGRGEKRRV